MPLSRLDNFLRNPEGNILYVDPNNFDATDSIENRGDSLVRPFVSIQRALIEAARFSYQQGKNNDLNDRTTIMVYPSTHYIDNRPGYSIQDINGDAVYKKRVGKDNWQTTTLDPLSFSSNFDIFDTNNDLYKFNSIAGGVILPRGTSIIGVDLRKTKIKPLYVPNPYDEDIDLSSIFNVTGTCYFSTFTFFDADTTKTVFKDYTDNRSVPNFSHHKLTAFTYADGVNKARLGYEQTDLTDLQMYYYKVARAYGDISGRGLGDYPINTDFEPNIDEYRIVGSLQSNPLGISSIRAGNGDGTGNNSIITVTTADLQTGTSKSHGLFIDTPVLISGITEDAASYNGSFIVKEVVGLTTFTFSAVSTPTNFLPDSTSFDTATVVVESDTVSSASPYIFNCSLRSVYGMCGMHGDGSKADGFKSMVVAQYTGVSLQKDDNAFLIYDDGVYYDNLTLPNSSTERPLHTNSRAIYKPSFENYHIKTSNDGFIQSVSIFAIGFAKHFVTESGGDMSITNSNSNFGAISLESIGFRKESFDRDDVGYITHIIPPKEITSNENEVTWLSIDTYKTISPSNTSKKLYISNYRNKDVIPPSQTDGYRIGAKIQDKLYLTVTQGLDLQTFESPIYMPVPSGGEGTVSKKEYNIARSGDLNNISSNILTLTENHQLFNGERVRIFSDTGQAPDGIQIDKVYYAITGGFLSDNQIQLAFSLNDAISRTPIQGINNNGGRITVLSTVSDKFPGDLGHPVQWDETAGSWYITSSQFTTENKIYGAVVGLGTGILGLESPSTYFKRKLDNRAIEDKIYKLRYVIPKEYVFARPPQAGFILQESKTVGITSLSIDEGTNLSSPIDLRNEKVINNVVADSIVDNSQLITITTEVPHNFVPGDTVKVQKIKSSNNTSGIGIVSTYNGSYPVIDVLNSKSFTYRISGVSTNPGNFLNAVNSRTTRQQRDDLPLVSRESYLDNYFAYRVNTIKRHIPGDDGQDGIYHIIMLSSSVRPEEIVGYGVSEKTFNQDVRNLYPQIDRDNYVPDPLPSISYADLNILGKVVTDDKKKSSTRESLNQLLRNSRVGFGITGLVISGTGNTTITLYTDIEHKLNSIKSLSVVSSGAGYPISSSIYSANLIDQFLLEEDASCRFNTTVTGAINSSTLKLVDVGSAHTVGQRLEIQGGSFGNNAVVNVQSINNNVNDALDISGFYSTIPLNGTFKIIEVPNSKTVKIYHPTGISSYVENSNSDVPIGYLASKGVGITSFSFTNVSSGIVTVTTNQPHGLLPGNKISIVGSGHTMYNSTFTVSDNIGINTFTFNVGIVTQTKSSTTGFVFKHGISANAKNLGRGEENLGSRASTIYAGVTTTISQSITENSTIIRLESSSGFYRGDYITLNSEIIRLASSANGNEFNILRGQFGTVKTNAPVGSLIKKIKVLPMELRRPSFMRASGHTFEYLGYGPGNYSTGLPQKQNRILDEDDILTSQAREQRGGTVVYTGMNDSGEFFSGSKKLISATGEEKVIEAPILTYTGDDAEGENSNRLSGVFDEILVRERITVEGGENNNQSSQFYGPVNFTQKITNLSDDGILTKNLFIRGTASQEKLFTVGLSTPTSAIIPNPTLGDISYISNPSNGYIGHIYIETEWRPWGPISRSADILDFKFDRLGIGTISVGNYNFSVKGDTIIQNLRVTGQVVFDQTQSLGDVAFEDIIVNRTARFTGTGIDPLTGLGTSYTQIHERGISRLNHLEVVGVSTFSGNVYINNNLFVDAVDLDEIRVGIAASHIIDTKTRELVLKSKSGDVIVNSNFKVADGNVSISTTKNISLPNLGVVTAYINEASILRLGVGNTNQTSYVEFNNDIRVFPDYGLRIGRSSGVGNVTSDILHRGTAALRLIAVDSADVSILTSNTEKLRIGSSGTITSYQNNSGQNLRGAHFKINQGGIGDVAMSWDITHNNSNIRWYAGIDTSDGYSWKLASPLVSVPYGNENFDVDTKLRVDSNGNAQVSGNITLGGSNFISTSTGIFNLLNTNVTTVNAFGSANIVNIAANSVTSRVNILGTTDSNNANSGALVVSGGVGIAKNLNVAGNARVSGIVTVNQNLVVDGTAQLATVDINGGNIDGTIIGAATRAAANFTSINVNADSTFNGVNITDVVLKKYGETVYDMGSIAGNRNINLNDGNVFIGTLTANSTFTITNPLTGTNVGSSFTLILTNGTGGPYSVSWNPASNVKFPNNLSPVRTQDAGKTDIWIFITPNQGSTWYGNIALYNFS